MEASVAPYFYPSMVAILQGPSLGIYIKDGYET
jgi:hypothetical protein